MHEKIKDIIYIYIYGGVLNEEQHENESNGGYL